MGGDSFGETGGARAAHQCAQLLGGAVVQGLVAYRLGARRVCEGSRGHLPGSTPLRVLLLAQARLDGLLQQPLRRSLAQRAFQERQQQVVPRGTLRQVLDTLQRQLHRLRLRSRLPGQRRQESRRQSGAHVFAGHRGLSHSAMPLPGPSWPTAAALVGRTRNPLLRKSAWASVRCRAVPCRERLCEAARLSLFRVVHRIPAKARSGRVRRWQAASGLLMPHRALRESVSVGAEAGQPLRMRRLLPSGAPRSPQMPKLRQLSWTQSAFVSGQVGHGSRFHFADRITETAVPAVRARCSIKDAAAQQVRCCPHADLHTRRKPRWNDRHGFLPRVARAAPARAWLVKLVHPCKEIAVKGRRWLPGRRHCVARVVPVLHAETM